MRKGHPTRKGQTILVVDDQEDSLISVRHLLEGHGHRVVTARSGEEALTVLEKEPVQIALVDYSMPQMSGADLIRQIRSHDPFLQIILHTGYCSRYTAHSLLKELGIQGFHDKTDGPDKLLLWIQAALKQQSSIEKLLRRERAHRELIAHVSHELNNPLHVICGYGDVLLDGATGTLPAQAEAAVHVVAGKAYALSDMTSNILLYSQLESEAVQVVPREIDLDGLLRDLPELVDLRLAGKNVAFTLDVEDRTLRLTIDAAKVEVILRNLLSNAAKFTHQGSIYLRVAALGADVEFIVRDTGPGIAAEHLEDVFQPFWQTKSSRNLGGIGLGLALSRRLALLLAGSLRVSSEVGVGSDFTLTVPIRPKPGLPAGMHYPGGKRTIVSGEMKTSRSPFGFFRPF